MKSGLHYCHTRLWAFPAVKTIHSVTSNKICINVRNDCYWYLLYLASVHMLDFYYSASPAYVFCEHGAERFKSVKMQIRKSHFSRINLSSRLDYHLLCGEGAI